MKDIKQYLPNNFQWNLGEGLVKGVGQKQKWLADAVPIVIERTLISNHVTHSTKKLIKMQYQDAGGKLVGEAQEFTEEEIMNGKFIKGLPIEVETGCGSTLIQNVFRSIIQAQAKEITVERKEIYPFGWYEKKFHWLEGEIEMPNISQEQEYKTAGQIAVLLARGNHVVTSLVLGMIHGPLKGVLQASGVPHDFVTFIVGATGVGKTDAAKKICRCLPNKETVVSLGSKRAELKKFIQNEEDVTLIVDDFNTSASDRVVSSQLQTLSEIIQWASDSGALILDDTPINRERRGVHLVVTSESIIYTPSMLNRCCLVNMEESLPDDCWNEVTYMAEHNCFFAFLRAFTSYIERNFDKVVARCNTDFAQYKQLIREKGGKGGGSMNRITETLAVQYTIKKLLADYLEDVRVNEKLRRRAEKSMDCCISVCGQDLQQEINKMYAKGKELKLLPTLAVIFQSDGNGGYEYAKDERSYRKAMKRNEKVIGFCVHANPRFISFDRNYMCKLIAEELGVEAVSARCLGQELSETHLAHVEYSERKQSCRWGTEYKYYHVDYYQLIDLIYVPIAPGSDILLPKQEFCNSISGFREREWYD